MKTPIEVKDIRKGDLIRVEYDYRTHKCAAIEYIAECDNEYANPSAGFYYLLERPEPPFEPHWGMVIGHPKYPERRAAYVGGNRYCWISSVDAKMGVWGSNDWARDMLANGWVIIEKPEHA